MDHRRVLSTSSHQAHFLQLKLPTLPFKTLPDILFQPRYPLVYLHEPYFSKLDTSPFFMAFSTFSPLQWSQTHLEELPHVATSTCWHPGQPSRLSSDALSSLKPASPTPSASSPSLEALWSGVHLWTVFISHLAGYPAFIVLMCVCIFLLCGVIGSSGSTCSVALSSLVGAVAAGRWESGWGYSWWSLLLVADSTKEKLNSTAGLWFLLEKSCLQKRIYMQRGGCYTNLGIHVTWWTRKGN